MIVKFKNFGSTEEFEKWQMENTIEIKMIVPIALSTHTHKDNYKEDGYLQYGVMVTYVKL